MATLIGLAREKTGAGVQIPLSFIHSLSNILFIFVVVIIENTLLREIQKICYVGQIWSKALEFII